MHKQLRFAAMVSTFAAACGTEDIETVQATQEGVTAGEHGVGIMAPSGIDIPDAGLRADDVTIFIRSYDPQSCAMPNAANLLEEATAFSWAVFLMLPADQLVVGTTFDFGGNEEAGPTIGFADSVGGHGGPAGIWIDSGLHCNDDTYDLPSSGQIVAVDEESITIEIHELCFTDYGPLQDDLSDDPTDDVTYRADGRYTVSLCSAPPTAP